MNSRRMIIFITGLILFSLIFSIITTPTRAAPNLTFTVTSNTDMVDVTPGDGVCETATGNGMCTLRAAIMEANGHIGADTIILPAATYNLTILGANEDFSATGDLDIRESLTISGDQNGSTIVDAAGLGDRVLHITHFNGLASISNVRIQHGDSSQDGGGIYSNAPLELNNCSITYNHADYSGGGIFSGSPLTITNGFIYDNDAFQDGGGIYSHAPLIIRRSSLTSNACDRSGGGLYIIATTYLQGVSFLSNYSIHSGGAVYNYGAKLTLLDSYLLGNINDENGGAIYNTSDGAISMSNVHVALNNAHLSGAGIYNEGILEGQDVQFDQNTSETANGGAILNKGDINLTEAVFSKNQATNGGAISNFLSGSLSLIDSAVISNTASDEGGGLINIYYIYLQDVSIRNNFALNGGGIVNYDWLDILNSTINDNVSTNGPGGIDNKGSLFVQNSTFSGNESQNYYGGGIFNSGSSVVTNSTIVNNMSSSSGIMAWGGGIYTTSGASFILRNTILYGNHHKELAWVVDDDCYGDLTTDHYNLVGTIIVGCTLVGSQGLDKIGEDPLLGELSDNGGNTYTHALMAGSPAIDAGNPAGCLGRFVNPLKSDQRGYLRHWDGDGDGTARCDIGAFEYNSRMQSFLPIAQK